MVRFILLASLLLAACARRPAVFRLEKDIVVPPPIAAKAFRGLDADAKEDLRLRSTAHDSRTAHDIRYSQYRDKGYLDLTAGMALRVVTPLMKDGGFLLPKASLEQRGLTIEGKADGLLGIETTYYKIERKPVGLTIEPQSVEQRRGDAVTHPAMPASDFLLPLQKSPAKFLRILFLTRVSEADHDMAILSADDKPDLDARSKQMTCNDKCLWVPRGIAVRPEIPIQIGNAPAYAPIDATVRTLIQDAHLPTLRIMRRYGKRLLPLVFDRTDRAILNVIVLPGDELNW